LLLYLNQSTAHLYKYFWSIVFPLLKHYFFTCCCCHCCCSSTKSIILHVDKEGELSQEWGLDFFKVSFACEKFFAKANLFFQLEKNNNNFWIYFDFFLSLFWEFRAIFVCWKKYKYITNPRVLVVFTFLVRKHLKKNILRYMSREFWSNFATIFLDSTHTRVLKIGVKMTEK